MIVPLPISATTFMVRSRNRGFIFHVLLLAFFRLCYFKGIIASIPSLYGSYTAANDESGFACVNVCTGSTACEKYHCCWLIKSQVLTC